MIRDAEKADIPALAQVAARAYAHAFADILEPEALAVYDSAYFQTRFAERWPRTRVAGTAVDILAFCVVTDGHIDMIFADPAAIGTGLGRALLEDAEMRGARSLECFEANIAARRFYERHSWRVARAYAREFAGRERRFVWMEKVREAGSISGPRG